MDPFALGDFQKSLTDAVIASLDNYHDKAGQVLTNHAVRAGFSALMLEMVYEALRKNNPPSPE